MSKSSTKITTTLNQMKVDLLAESTATRGQRKIVTLDQQMVGRLSRMDAIQQQSMANAIEARRKLQIARIDATLDRFNKGEFGYCLECGDKIAEDRLALDLTIPRCKDCTMG
jgi:DnaK suppressor protein